jgi:hypothetical protein
MILIITHKEDYTADFVIDKLNNQGISYFRFNCEDFLSNEVSVNIGNSQSNLIAGHSSFTSIWYRRIKLPNIQAANEAERLYLLGEADVFLQDLFGIINGKWLSHPAAVHKAENKLLQLSLAQKVGFKIPDTLVTTDRTELKRFASKHKKMIVKPIGHGRINYPDNSSKLIFSNLLNQNIIDRIDGLELTPAIYQEYIEKDYELRVTVIDQDIFAASVNSQSDTESSIDWRKKRLKFDHYNLPEPLKSKCLRLIRGLNISFGAFDFIKSTNGQYYFLEVNPNGQWVWIEKDTGQLISDSIIKFLTHE